MLNFEGKSVKNKLVTISGSGNVAQYAAEKCIHLGAKVISMSDSAGVIFDKDGIDEEKLGYIMYLKNKKRTRIEKFITKFPDSIFLKNTNPWSLQCDIALPCATQNELSEKDAILLIKNGCILLFFL